MDERRSSRTGLWEPQPLVLGEEEAPQAPHALPRFSGSLYTLSTPEGSLGDNHA
jgi:hypothetical protein